MDRNPLDIVVGVCTKNCADTVAGVLKAVDRGLAQFFPATPQTGGLGKGNGVRTILEIARDRGASAVALVDGDLTSIKTNWVHKLAGPILAGRDLVVPYYLRHHYDGVITNQIAYPLTNVLFGVGVRQPIGGEYGISARLLERLLQHELFPEKFGIDIFITLVATSEQMEIGSDVLSSRRDPLPIDQLLPRLHRDRA
jgi:hypothetical protein